MVEDDALELALTCHRFALCSLVRENLTRWPRASGRFAHERPANTPRLRVVRIPPATERM